MKQNKVLSMIGLATKAGKTVSGEFSTEKAVKSYKAFLVIISEDASKNTTKKFRNMCEFYEVPILVYAGKEELGHAMGKGQRSSMAFLDEGFAKSVIEKVRAEEQLNMENLSE